MCEKLRTSTIVCICKIRILGVEYCLWWRLFPDGQRAGDELLLLICALFWRRSSRIVSCKAVCDGDSRDSHRARSLLSDHFLRDSKFSVRNKHVPGSRAQKKLWISNPIRSRRSAFVDRASSVSGAELWSRSSAFLAFSAAISLFACSPVFVYSLAQVLVFIASHFRLIKSCVGP